MQVIVDGLMTTYERAGSGPAVLLLHGWGDRVASWEKFIAELASHYELVAVDLPGFGGTDTPHDTWGLDDYATFVAHFLAKVDVHPYGIVGHSNGGALAIHGVGVGLLECKKLVLLASAGIRNGGDTRKRAVKVVAKTGKLLSKPLPARTQRALRQKLYGAVGSDMLVAEHLQETFKKVVSEDVRADAARIAVPTLLIYGEQDRDTPVRYGELLHEAIDGSTLEILPGAGHFVHQERQADVLHAVREFLA